jgi:polar amino acid transport system ATP-binding protein
MSMPAEPLIRAENVRKCFGDSWILRGVSADVHKYEALVVIGPSGSGKTTSGRCMNPLEPIDEGSIAVVRALSLDLKEPAFP